MLTSLANSAPGALQPTIDFAYDPLMRLAAIDSTNSGFDVEFGYDGQEMVLEALSGGRTRRYVFGPGTDEPLVGYLVTPGVGTSRLWYQADERGSIARHSNDAGTPSSTIGKYDEYGAGGTGRFRYTGQYWLGEANLLYYRARVYDARLGRFLQPDPIGYGAGMNMYAYVGGDPVNFTDPSGLEKDVIHPDITINGGRLQVAVPAAAVAAAAALMGAFRSHGGNSLGTIGLMPDTTPIAQVEPDIFVTAQRKISRVPIPKSLPLRLPPWVQIVIDNIVGYPTACIPREGCTDQTLIEEGNDAVDARAPGKPGTTEGFKEPKLGQPEWVRNPNGSGGGWIDADGRVWVPTGPGPSAHGGPHWDVQDPRSGGHKNVYPGGRVR